MNRDVPGGQYQQAAQAEGGFICIPREQKVVPGVEAEQLRYHLWMMIAFHCGFLFLELIAYEIIAMLIFFEMFYIWLAYYSVMNLSKYSLMAYIFFMGLSPTGILRVFEVGHFLSIVLYLMQMVFYVFGGCYITYNKLNAWNAATANQAN